MSNAHEDAIADHDAIPDPAVGAAADAEATPTDVLAPPPQDVVGDDVHVDHHHEHDPLDVHNPPGGGDGQPEEQEHHPSVTATTGIVKDPLAPENNIDGGENTNGIATTADPEQAALDAGEEAAAAAMEA